MRVPLAPPVEKEDQRRRPILFPLPEPTAAPDDQPKVRQGVQVVEGVRAQRQQVPRLARRKRAERHRGQHLLTAESGASQVPRFAHVDARRDRAVPEIGAVRDPTPGEKARQVRRSLSLRLADVAAAIGTNGGDLSKVERGLRPMSPAMLARIVGVLRRAGAGEEQLKELEGS